MPYANFPAAQVTQPVEPSVFWYCPTPHAAQDDDAADADAYPTAQTLHVAEPAVSWYVPAVHAEQLEAAEDEYRPVLQLEHELAPPAE